MSTSYHFVTEESEESVEFEKQGPIAKLKTTASKCASPCNPRLRLHV
jgi:hypothetical protein